MAVARPRPIPAAIQQFGNAFIPNGFGLSYALGLGDLAPAAGDEGDLEPAAGPGAAEDACVATFMTDFWDAPQACGTVAALP